MLIDFREGTLNTTPEEYNKEYNSSDPWILLEQWSFHTYHTDVKKFVENIMNHMYVHNLNNKNKKQSEHGQTVLVGQKHPERLFRRLYVVRRREFD